MRKNQKIISASPWSDESNGGSAQSRLNGSYDQTVRERAYEIYETRLAGNIGGDDVSDWLQAEEQVRRQFSPAQAIS